MVFGVFFSHQLSHMVFENVLKFDLCHTSPFVFNSCITYFSFLPRLRNISSLFLNFVSGELPFFSVSSLFYFSSSFHSRFFVSLSCESSILFTSLFKKKKPPRVFHSLFILSSFFLNFFSSLFCFHLVDSSFGLIFRWSPFFGPLEKNFPLSPLFLSTSLFSHPLFFVSFFRLYFLFFLSFFPSFFHSCHGIHGHR